LRNKSSQRRSNCPISYALDIFGDKWTLLVIRDMLFKGKQRYGQFAESEERIATNILADRLARLEAQGLVTSEPDPQNGRQVVYALTSKALDLAPMLVEMIVWSAKHDPRSAADGRFVRKATSNRQQLLSEIKVLSKRREP
jgi:DNA-binding HxlR family transcriptional regulator